VWDRDQQLWAAGQLRRLRGADLPERDVQRNHEHLRLHPGPERAARTKLQQYPANLLQRHLLHEHPDLHWVGVLHAALAGDDLCWWQVRQRHQQLRADGQLR
jgi:hypothetical protein